MRSHGHVHFSGGPLHGSAIVASFETSTTLSTQRARPSGQSTPLIGSATDPLGAGTGDLPLGSQAQYPPEHAWQPSHAEAALVDHAFERRMPVFVTDADRLMPDLASRLNTRSALLLPLSSGTDRIGVLDRQHDN